MATIAEYIDPLKKLTMNPLFAGLLTGGVVAAGSRLAYPLASGALSRVYSHMGTSPAETAELDRELNGYNSKWKTWLPLALGGMTTAAFLASAYNPSTGLKSLVLPWGNRSLPAVPKKSSTVFIPDKTASDYFDWNINDQSYLDFGKIIPVRTAKDIVLNDPNSEVYHKGNALSIINNAAAGKPTVSAGDLFDSALNTVQRNLTLEGVTGAAVRGVIGYGMAKAFTNTIGSMMDMPKAIRNAIVDTGMISSVITGLA